MKVKNLCLGDTYVVTHPCTLLDYMRGEVNCQQINSSVLYLYAEFYDAKLGRCYKDVLDGKIYSYGFPLEAEIGTGFIKFETLDFNAVSDMLASHGYTKTDISKRKLKKILKQSLEYKKNDKE